MWLLFGIAAVSAAVCHLLWAARGRDGRIWMFLSLSLTALTLCAFYGQSARWVQAGDWTALADTAATVSRRLWLLTAFSILLNSASLFGRRE